MGSEKGQGFEREICRYLSFWWSEGKADDIFWRNRTHITSKTPFAEKQLGDVACMKTPGLPFIETFNVELKSGYSKTTTAAAKKENDRINKGRVAKGKAPLPLSVRNTPWDLLDIIDSNSKSKPEVVRFWEQCEEDAMISNRIPILIFKRDFHQPVVCINPLTFIEIIEYSGKVNNSAFLSLTIDHRILYFYKRDDFFEWLSPGIVKIIHNRNQKEN
jgi:hypothetical protein